MATMRGLIEAAEKKADRPYAHGPMAEYDWKAVAKAMGGRLVRPPKGKKEPAKVFYKNELYTFHDNGGEINITKDQDVGSSVPFWSTAHEGGSVGPATLAYRLGAEIAGQAIDYKRDLDGAPRPTAKQVATAKARDAEATLAQQAGMADPANW